MSPVKNNKKYRRRNNFLINLIKIKRFLFFAACVILAFAFILTASANSDVFGKKEDKKYVALTFDDGPHPVYTQKILDILEEKKVTATFFVVGSRAELHPDKIKRMKKMDCEIGNHTYSHADLWAASRSKTVAEIEKCSAAIFAITGEEPIIYRPPFGRIRKDNENCVPLRKILWTVDSLDWNTKSKDRVINNIVNNVKDGSIVLMHDFYNSTLSALPEIIDILREAGYEFKTVSELAAMEKISNLQEYFMDE